MNRILIVAQAFVVDELHFLKHRLPLSFVRGGTLTMIFKAGYHIQIKRGEHQGKVGTVTKVVKNGTKTFLSVQTPNNETFDVETKLCEATGSLLHVEGRRARGPPQVYHEAEEPDSEGSVSSESSSSSSSEDPGSPDGDPSPPPSPRAPAKKRGR